MVWLEKTKNVVGMMWGKGFVRDSHKEEARNHLRERKDMNQTAGEADKGVAIRDHIVKATKTVLKEKSGRRISNESCRRR